MTGEWGEAEPQTQTEVHSLAGAGSEGGRWGWAFKLQPFMHSFRFTFRARAQRPERNRAALRRVRTDDRVYCIDSVPHRGPAPISKVPHVFRFIHTNFDVCLRVNWV